MRTCPDCAEQITQRGATCPYCGADLRPAAAGTHGSQPVGLDAGMRMILPVGRSGWAIAAGYLGLISVLLFPAPFAVLCSVIAMSQLKKNPKLHGMGRAIFGLVMGIGGTLLLLLAMVVWAVKS